MKSTLKLLSLLLSLSFFASQYSINASAIAESSASGYIITENGKPLSNIKINIYSSAIDYIGDGETIYSHKYETSVYSDNNGYYSFFKPSSNFLLEIDLNTLPDKHGVNISESFVESGDKIPNIKVSEISKIEINEQNVPVLFNKNNNEIFANYSLKSNLSSATDARTLSDTSIISNTITINANGFTKDLTSNIDISDASLIEKADILYQNKLISQEEKIESYLLALETNDIGGIGCLSDIYGELYNYYSEHKNSKLGSKINNSLLFENSNTKGDELPSGLSYSDIDESVTGRYTLHFESDPNAIGYMSPSVVSKYTQFVAAISAFYSANGFLTPNFEDGESTYHIYFSGNHSLLTNNYGFTKPSGNGSYICIKYPLITTQNTDNDIKKTLAHEIFHSIQYRYNNNQSIGNWFSEASATWAGLAYINAYLPYAKTHANNYLATTARRLSDYGSSDNRNYGMFLLPQYIYQNYGGINSIKRILLSINNGNNLYTALTKADSSNTATFADIFAAFQMYNADTRKYNYYCDPNNNSNRYNNATKRAQNSSSFTSETVLSTAAKHYGYKPQSGKPYLKLSFTINNNAYNNARIVFVRFPGDGSSSKTYIYKPASSKFTYIRDSFINSTSSSVYSDLTVVACNIDTSNTGSYTFGINKEYSETK